jgi:hypothetical protein
LHGDPNPGNFIVDLENQKVTFIDLSLFSSSLTPDEKPQGNAFKEYLEAVSCLWIVGERMGLSEEEITTCQTTFSNAYKRAAKPDQTTPEAFAFFDCYWNLRGINTLFKKLPLLPLAQRDPIQEEILLRYQFLYRK